MTNKEAIEQLKWVQKRISDITYSPESFEALNLAIKALKLIDCPQIIDECKACGGFCIDEKEAADNDSK